MRSLSWLASPSRAAARVRGEGVGRADAVAAGEAESGGDGARRARPPRRRRVRRPCGRTVNIASTAPLGSGPSGHAAATHWATNASSAACWPLTFCSAAASAPTAERQRRVEHQPGDLVRMRARVGERHLCAVADAEQGDAWERPRCCAAARCPRRRARCRRRSRRGRSCRCSWWSRSGRSALRLATGSSPDSNCAWSSISWRSNRSRQSRSPDMPMPRRSTATIGVGLEDVGAAAGQPHRQLHRRRQVRAGGHHQRPGVGGRRGRPGPHHADAQRARRAVDGVEVGVVARAFQRHAGHGGHARRG